MFHSRPKVSLYNPSRYYESHQIESMLRARIGNPCLTKIPSDYPSRFLKSFEVLHRFFLL
jgi:hypothetical protein